MTTAELAPFIFSSLLLHKIQTICRGHNEPDSKTTQAVKRFVLFIFCSFQRPVLLLSLLYIVMKCAKDDTVWAPLEGRKWNLLRSTSQVLRSKRVESTRKSVSHQIQTGGSDKLSHYISDIWVFKTDSLKIHMKLNSKWRTQTKGGEN